MIISAFVNASRSAGAAISALFIKTVQILPPVKEQETDAVFRLSSLEASLLTHTR